MIEAARVRIGISSLDVAALPLYAEANGAFASAGLAVAIERDLGHPNEVAALVAAGRLDLGYVDIITALRGAQRCELELLAPGGLYDSAEPIVVLAVAREAPERSPQELAAGTIVTPGEHDLARLGVRAWVARAGGDGNTVQFRSGIPMRDASDVLDSGLAAAMIVSEPQRTLQAARLAEAAAPFDAIAPAFIMGAYVAAPTWCDAQQTTAAKLREVLRQTARWANGHHDETASILAQRLQLDPMVVARMRRAAYAERWDETLLAPVRSVARRYGEITG